MNSFFNLSTHPSIHLLIPQSTHSTTHFPASITHPSNYPFTHPSIHPPIHLRIDLLAYHSTVYSSIHLPLSIHPSTNTTIYLPIQIKRGVGDKEGGFRNLTPGSSILQLRLSPRKRKQQYHYYHHSNFPSTSESYRKTKQPGP